MYSLFKRGYQDDSTDKTFVTKPDILNLILRTHAMKGKN